MARKVDFTVYNFENGVQIIVNGKGYTQRQKKQAIAENGKIVSEWQKYC